MAIPGNIKRGISAIRAPMLIIHGKEDLFYSVEARKDIASAILRAKLMILDGMGHSFPPEVLPRIISALVENSNKKSN